jgi:hypothetical protein
MDGSNNIVNYSLGISLFSPTYNLYQIGKLHNIKLRPINYLKFLPGIYPQQVLLRIAQVNICTIDKEHPLVGFGVMGMIQGIIYGNANIYYSNILKISERKKMNMAEAWRISRGSSYAFWRDLISQGIPFVYADKFKNKVLDPFLPNKLEKEKELISIFALTLVSTVLSHGLHNCQTIMQTNSNNLSCLSAPAANLYAKHGYSFLYKGLPGRMGLLLVTNIFNYTYLKPLYEKTK